MQSELRMRVNSLLMRTLEKATLEVVSESVIMVCNHYNLDVGEALALVGGVRSEEVSMKKRGGSKAKVSKELKSVTKPEKQVKEKSAFPLPFGVKVIVEGGCCGLAYNNGLFTQCEKVRLEGNYCKTCQKEADGSSKSKPLNGTVADRLSCALMDFRDTKGRAPLPYSRIMAKRGLTRETVEEEVARLNLEISEEHFEESSARGRPKVEKKKKVSAESVEDLLAKMMETREDDMTEIGSQADTEVMSDSEDDNEDGVNVEEELAHEKQERSDMKTAELEQKRVEKANKLAEEKAQRAIERASALATAREEKEAKLAQEKSERASALATAKAEKEAKLAQEKIEKEAKLAELALAKAEKEANLALAKAEKEAKIATQKAEKEAKLAQEKAEKEAKLALAKQEKEAKLEQEKAEKEAKLAQEKAEKEAKLASAKKPVSKKAQEKPAPVAKKAPEKPAPVAKKAPEKPAPASASASAPPAKKVTVTRITIEGIQYLKTTENLLYNPETKEEVGIYDPETQTIKPLPEESDDELDEDEYESDDN